MKRFSTQKLIVINKLINKQKPYKQPNNSFCFYTLLGTFKIMKQTEIGLIGNYYGCLNVMTLDGKFYWCIENYDTDFEDLEDWEEINEELYNSIINFYNSKKQ